MFDPVAKRAKYIVRLHQLSEDRARVAKKIVDVQQLIAKCDDAIAKQQPAAPE